MVAASVGTQRLQVTRTSKCGWAINRSNPSHSHPSDLDQRIQQSIGLMKLPRSHNLLIPPRIIARSTRSATTHAPSCPMIGENRQLVTDEPVEVQGCRKSTDPFRGIYRIYYPNIKKENRRMSSCNRWTCKH